MKDAGEILKELLNKSRQIVQFINEHAYGHSLRASNLRERYATANFYISLDWHIAVVDLTTKKLRGPALTLIRSMIESWIRGSWIRLVASDDEIEKVTTDSEFWRSESKSLWVLRNEVKEENGVLGEVLGEVMKYALTAVDNFLNNCVHGNNQYLNLYFNKETQTIEPNVPDDKMALMLDVANTIALWSALQMQELHAEDTDPLTPFAEKRDEYLAYSINLLKPLTG